MSTGTRAMQSAHVGRLLSAAALQFAALACFAGPISSDNLAFDSHDQSMWTPGQAGGLDIDRFLGVTWDESASVGGITGSVSTTTVEIPHFHSPSGWECHGFLCTGGHFHKLGGVHTHEKDTTLDTRTGGAVDVSTDGKMGFQFGLSAHSGSVDTSKQFDADLVVPETIAQGGFST